MTSNSNLKKQAREYAAQHGVAYAQARREITENNLTARAAEQGVMASQSVRVVTIQQEQRTDGVLPYPFHVDEFGFVGRQDFWRGDPIRLVGFVEDSDSFDVALDVEDFLVDPDAAVGMHPVLADRNGDFATYSGPVVSVTEHTAQRPVPETVTAHFNFGTADTAWTCGVGHLMGLLHSRDFEGPATDGVLTPDALHTLLGWACLDDGGQDTALPSPVIEAIIDGQVANLSIDVEQVKAWAAAMA